MNYKYITETFFEWTIYTGNYSSFGNQKGAVIRTKCTRKRLAACWGSLCAHPDCLAAMGVPTCKGMEGGGEGLLLRVDGREGRKTERKRKATPPQKKSPGK